MAFIENVDTAGILLCLGFNFLAVVVLSMYYLRGKQWSGQMSFDSNDQNNEGVARINQSINPAAADQGEGSEQRQGAQPRQRQAPFLGFRNNMEAPLIEKEDESVLEQNESELIQGAVGQGGLLLQGSNVQHHFEYSDLGSVIQKENSVLRFRVNNFGMNPNGVVNLGMAQHLFFPNDLSVIHTRNALHSSIDQSSIQGGATSGSNFMSSQGIGSTGFAVVSDRAPGSIRQQIMIMNNSSGMGSTGQDRSRENALGRTYLINETQQSFNERYLNMTIELLQCLEPQSRRRLQGDGPGDIPVGHDHFNNINGLADLGSPEDETNMIDLEYPRSCSHLLKILFRTNERKLLGLSNPDGYFYLYYLKACIKLFFFITVFGSVTISFLSYASYKKDLKENPILASRSIFDLVSLPSTMITQKVYYVALAATFIISAVAYYLLYGFCEEMSRFEFQPDQQILDQFIQLHTVMIHCVNTNISVEKAERGIRKVFSLRFGPDNILKIQLFRPTQNINKLAIERLNVKKHLKRQEKRNARKSGQQRQVLTVGSIYKCNRRTADAEDYYRARLKEIDAEMKAIQESSKKQNLGIAFISFKDRDCVYDTLEEIELVRQKMLDDKQNVRLGLQNWKVEQAYPPSDINWDQITTIDQEEGCKQWSIPFLNFSSTFLVGMVFLYLDSFAFRKYASLKLIFDYCCSFAFAYYVMYISPKIQYELTQWQNVERKSHKEESFLSRLNLMFVFNSAICPFLNGLLLEYGTGKGAAAFSKVMGGSEPEELTLSRLCLYTVMDVQPFYTRLMVQLIMLCIFDQLFLKFEKITAIHRNISKHQGKTKFEHWFYDLSFKSSLAITFFTVGLCLCLVYPHISVLMLILFSYQYNAEKYNLMYRYPLEFESQKISRMTLVKNSFYAVILFQVCMILLGVLDGASKLHIKTIVYLLCFVLIQLIVLITIFEFMRKPWQGAEVEIERILEEQQHRLFDDTISALSLTGRDEEPPQDQHAEANSVGNTAGGEISSNKKKAEIEYAKTMKQAHEQVLEQRFVFLKNAFNNPHERFLEYEPWLEEGEDERAATELQVEQEEMAGNQKTNVIASDNEKNSGKSSQGQSSSKYTRRKDAPSPTLFRDPRSSSDEIASQDSKMEANQPLRIEMPMTSSVDVQPQEQKQSATTEQHQIESINQKQKLLRDAVQNDVNLTIIAEEVLLVEPLDQRENGSGSNKNARSQHLLDESGRASNMEKST